MKTTHGSFELVVRASGRNLHRRNVFWTCQLHVAEVEHLCKRSEHRPSSRCLYLHQRRIFLCLSHLSKSQTDISRRNGKDKERTSNSEPTSSEDRHKPSSQSENKGWKRSIDNKDRLASVYEYTKGKIKNVFKHHPRLFFHHLVIFLFFCAPTKISSPSAIFHP